MKHLVWVTLLSAICQMHDKCSTDCDKVFSRAVKYIELKYEPDSANDFCEFVMMLLPNWYRRVLINQCLEIKVNDVFLEVGNILTVWRGCMRIFYDQSSPPGQMLNLIGTFDSLKIDNHSVTLRCNFINIVIVNIMWAKINLSLDIIPNIWIWTYSDSFHF